MKKIAFATHVALIDGKEVDGIGNMLLETLNTTEVEYYMVRHSMEGSLRSDVRHYKGRELLATKHLAVARKPAPLRYITEILATVYHFSFRQKVDVYVGIDPLNALVAIILKKLRRIEYCVFYTPDYSPQRFDNHLLNNIYHWIDRYCVARADEVWSVSARIQEVRGLMGLSEDRNILLPNVPPEKFGSLSKNPHNKHALITYGNIDKQLDYEGTIRALDSLCGRYPHLTLTLVGNGPEENRLQKLVKDLDLSDKVFFKGRQSLADTIEIASHCGIGLALYTGIWEFNHYGDSTKCREYLSLGLPVISTDSHSTVAEIREAHAGIIVESNQAAYELAIIDILNHYSSYSGAALKLGSKYGGIHLKTILRLVDNHAV